jgi:hypothetical protein
MRGWLILAIALSSVVASAADVTIVETLSVTAGGKTIRGTRTTYVSGERMRIDTVLPDQSAATVYDLPAGSIVGLDAKAKRAELFTLAARAAAVEKDYPRSRAKTTLQSTGATREIAGVACAEQAFTVRVPMVSDDSIALMLTGSAWIATRADGNGDYESFARAAREHDVVLGSSSTNRLVVARTRAQTELYRALSAAGGIPYALDMKYEVEGRGALAGIVRKALEGQQALAVSRVTTDSIAPTVFTVPDGWKRERK